MSFLVRFVVYLRGKLLHENTTLLGAYETLCLVNDELNLKSDDDLANALIFAEYLIKDHEYHLVDLEGNRLFDVYAVTG